MRYCSPTLIISSGEIIVAKGIIVEKPGKYLTLLQRKTLEKSLSTKELRPEYQCRIRIMLLADEGLTEAEISKTLRCSVKTARRWIQQAKTGRIYSWQARPRGRPKTANEEYLARLEELAMSSPRDYGYPINYWTGQWLSDHLAKELGVTISDRHINRLLKQMGLSSKY